jgi:hypothetical protein
MVLIGLMIGGSGLEQSGLIRIKCFNETYKTEE